MVSQFDADGKGHLSEDKCPLLLLCGRGMHRTALSGSTRSTVEPVEGLALSSSKGCLLNMNHYVYILQMRDGRYYVGMTNDIERRAGEHGVKSSTRTTKIFGFEEMLYVEQHPNRDLAHAREQQLKKWTRAKKEALINGDKNALRNLSRSHKH
jgi:predicted GIY-YIG superfamily endonuclease